MDKDSVIPKPACRRHVASLAEKDLKGAVKGLSFQNHTSPYRILLLSFPGWIKLKPVRTNHGEVSCRRVSVRDPKGRLVANAACMIPVTSILAAHGKIFPSAKPRLRTPEPPKKWSR